MKVLKKVNPHFCKLPGYSQNCDNAALVYDFYLKTGKFPSGHEKGAKPFFEKDQAAYLINNFELVEDIGFSVSVLDAHQFDTFGDMQSELASKPNGSRFYVKGYIETRPGYMLPDTWSAFIIDNKIYHLKPQSGKALGPIDFFIYRNFAYYQTF